MCIRDSRCRRFRFEQAGDEPLDMLAGDLGNDARQPRCATVALVAKSAAAERISAGVKRGRAVTSLRHSIRTALGLIVIPCSSSARLLVCLPACLPDKHLHQRTRRPRTLRDRRGVMRGVIGCRALRYAINVPNRVRRWNADRCRDGGHRAGKQVRPAHLSRSRKIMFLFLKAP